MAVKEIISSELAPKALGPYSVAVRTAGLVFTAGQLGIDPQTNDLVTGGVTAEARQALINIRNILQAAGSSMESVVKTTIFLRDMQDFQQVNQVYADFFPANYPARSTVQVAGLPKAAAVEIEAVAVI